MFNDSYDFVHTYSFGRVVIKFRVSAFEKCLIRIDPGLH